MRLFGNPDQITRISLLGISLPMAPQETGEASTTATRLSRIGDLMQRHPVIAALGLVALTLITHLIILATPGFFSHDEWQKFDHIRLHGFQDFARAYGEIKAGP